MDRVLILINYGLFIKTRAVWRNVNKDKKGEYVVIDREKRYLSEMIKENDFEYKFNQVQLASES